MKNSSSLFIRITSILILSVLQIQSCYSQEYYEEIVYPDTLGINCMLPLCHDTIIVGVVSDNPYAYGSVYRSFDSGETWEFAGLNQTHIYCFLHGIGDTIYAGTGYGVYRSFNYGANWDLILPMSRNVASLALFQQSKLYVGYWGGIMRSLDNGINWDSSLVLNQNSVINAILPISESEIYAGGTAYTSGDAGVFKSENLGISWENIGLVGNNIQALGLNSNHELYAGCYYSGLLKTSNDGLTWETIFASHDVVSIIMNFDEIYLGCENQNFPNGGIYYSSDNGQTWEDRTYNITNKRIVHINITSDQYFYSLSRYETIILGPPFNRSTNPVLVKENNFNNTSTIDLFPNPASDFLMISIPNELINNENSKVSIYNHQGQLVGIDSVYFSPDKLTKKINIAYLTNGIYFIKIVIGRYKYLHKLIKL